MKNKEEIKQDCIYKGVQILMGGKGITLDYSEVSEEMQLMLNELAEKEVEDK